MGKLGFLLSFSKTNIVKFCFFLIQTLLQLLVLIVSLLGFYTNIRYLAFQLILLFLQFMDTMLFLL